ncbi:hypothetical protein SLEP1_g11508 [Rubroshorea leprosula]|uniref:Uncharacterized protein n=1 Tax=Rubroshorea leprosula TaxID=152421 RepID=A0AAV5ILD4_9ROSI|nr:hypothetical protein SLEP1_g11508 [Rubroshorea leprosula]
MERSEPTLVPEWLRSTGSVTGGGNSAHHSTSSSSHTDVNLPSHHLRNRNTRSTSDFDSPRSAFLDRTSSSNSRRSSSNGSAKHAYGSFSRNHRDKDRERDKERTGFGDHWDNDSSDALASILTSRVEKNTLRRSHSMVSRKHGELFPGRVTADSKDTGNGNHSNGNGLLSGSAIVSSSIQKSAFEKDFPTLGTEEKQRVPDIPRVSSPGLSSAVQSLPVSSSSLIGGERWTSALAEVPTLVGTGSAGSLSVLQTVSASGSGVPSPTNALNMAEALAQAPSRTRTDPQVSIKTQKLEELAIKQSRQLIPVTPSMPKGLVLNSSDKSKPKTAVRPVEMNMAVKSGQQQPPSLHHGNQSQVGNMKSDVTKATHGKLLVLKQARENGILSPQKDIPNLANNANSRVANNQLSASPSVQSALLQSSNSLKLRTGERKVAGSNLLPGFAVEKRPLAQTQSRNDFFNLLKKKNGTNTSSDLPDAGPNISSPIAEKSEVTKEVVSPSATPHAFENGAAATSNGITHQEGHRFSDDEEKDTSYSTPVLPEEEAAFLRSLGWDGKYCEDEGLTEEEINDFYQELKLRPTTLKLCHVMQSKLPEAFATNLDGASSVLSSSDSKSEA